MVHSLVPYVPHGDFNPLRGSTLGVHFGGPLGGMRYKVFLQLVTTCVYGLGSCRRKTWPQGLLTLLYLFVTSQTGFDFCFCFCF